MFQPMKLSVFALEASSNPIASLPFYAELVAPTPVVPDLDFLEPLTEALANDPPVRAEAAPLARVQAAVAEAIARVLTPDARNTLKAEYQSGVDFLRAVLVYAQKAADTASLVGLTGKRLEEALETGIEQAAEDVGLDVVPETSRDRSGTAYPLGVLATDHAGYLSFDLERLPVAVRQQLWVTVDKLRADPNARRPVSVWLYAMGLEALRFDALEQCRFAEDAIVTRLEFGTPVLVPPVIRAAGFPSMQAPSLADWRLSGASFAASPAALLGEDEGCENILPANLATQEFGFYQVVGLTDAQDPIPADLRPTMQLGLIHEFRTAWYPLGHSLGSILYSMPLAPGESVNLAVVDWTRRDDAQRKEVTKLDEQLVHQEHRDRTISETVSTSLRELQRGSSFMAGLAESGGVSANMGYVGIAAGHAGSIGGSTASSSGSRDIAANAVQTVNDRIAQASAAQRELQSTVVVHSTQTEKEAIETRTVVNYNHSHALTILYYEVLRHYRVVTEVVRRRPAVLVKLTTDWFPEDPKIANRNVVIHRQALEAALLDPSLAPAFDAVDRIDRRRQVNEVFPPQQPPAGPPIAPEPPGPHLRFFWFEMTTGDYALDQEDEEYIVNATLFWKDITLLGGDPHDPIRLDASGSFKVRDRTYSFLGRLPAPKAGEPWRDVPWGEIDAIRIRITRKNRKAILSFKHIKVTGIDAYGGKTVLVDEGYPNGPLILDYDFDIWLPTARAPLPPAPPSRPAQDVQDDLDRARLMEHLRDHLPHYSRTIFFAMNPVDRAALLGPAALHLENRPMEIVGDHVAFPCTNQTWAKAVMQTLPSLPEPEERLATLPTRGVFAEAKLGHCNASEEIDNTRFWDWQSSPIPHMAPEIAPVQVVVPQAQQQDTSSTAFPQSLVNIVNPPTAPDPTGLAAALNVLGTPNIFRDMSGQAQVADLLMRLSDNSVRIAEAANIAGRVQGSGGGAQGGRSSSGSSQGTMGLGRGNFGSTPALSGQRATPNQPSAASRGLQDTGNDVRKLIRDGLMTPQRGRDLVDIAAQNAVTGGSDHSFQEVAASVADVRKWLDLINFVPPEAIVKELSNRNMSVQSIFGVGYNSDLNVDDFSVSISKMPSLNGDVVSPEGFLKYFRLHLNDFTFDGNNPFTTSSFQPISQLDEPRWKSDNPLGAVLLIDVPGPDNAAVVVADFDALHWRFCTVRTPVTLTGSHPVSGTREFGIRGTDGSWQVYTRGADRATDFIETFAANVATFPGGAALWEHVQDRVAKFVNQNGGSAQILQPYSKRFPWFAVNMMYGDVLRPSSQGQVI